MATCWNWLRGNNTSSASSAETHYQNLPETLEDTEAKGPSTSAQISRLFNVNVAANTLTLYLDDGTATSQLKIDLKAMKV